jgi:hypothetical protein
VFVGDAEQLEGRHCWLYLYDAQAALVASRQVLFYTNATAWQDVPAGGVEANRTGGVGDGDDGGKAARCQACASFNPACYLAKGCWGKLGGLLGMAGGGALGRAFCCCCCGLCRVCARVRGEEGCSWLVHYVTPLTPPQNALPNHTHKHKHTHASAARLDVDPGRLV